MEVSLGGVGADAENAVCQGDRLGARGQSQAEPGVQRVGDVERTHVRPHETAGVGAGQDQQFHRRPRSGGGEARDGREGGFGKAQTGHWSGHGQGREGEISRAIGLTRDRRARQADRGERVTGSREHGLAGIGDRADHRWAARGRDEAEHGRRGRHARADRQCHHARGGVTRRIGRLIHQGRDGVRQSRRWPERQPGELPPRQHLSWSGQRRAIRQRDNAVGGQAQDGEGQGGGGEVRVARGHETDRCGRRAGRHGEGAGRYDRIARGWANGQSGAAGGGGARRIGDRVDQR